MFEHSEVRNKNVKVISFLHQIVADVYLCQQYSGFLTYTPLLGERVDIYLSINLLNRKPFTPINLIGASITTKQMQSS